jgi:hypothetical protein
MKRLQLIPMIVCLALVVGCESTDTTGMGNQERKRLAAVQQQAQQPQPDESEQNLWNAQQDILNRDSNPARQP